MAALILKGINLYFMVMRRRSDHSIRLRKVQFITTYLNELIEAGINVNTVCLVARTNDLIKQYDTSLKEKGVKTYLIKGVSLMTGESWFAPGHHASRKGTGV